jgi:hypothetical protein
MLRLHKSHCDSNASRPHQVTANRNKCPRIVDGMKGELPNDGTYCVDHNGKGVLGRWWLSVTIL